MAPATSAHEAYDDFVARATADPNVVGILLCGSRSREEWATVHSDYDVIVVTSDRTNTFDELDGNRSEQLDLVVMDLETYRSYALPGRPDEWAAYGLARAQVVLDRLGGQIAELTAQKGVLTGDEARKRAAWWLDNYINSLYRSAKNHRDGRSAESHFDGAESVHHVIETLFALRGRVRPYNKYLRWELDRYPLGAVQWEADRLIPRLRRILADGDMASQRALFADVEQAARSMGFGAVLDSWGADLELLRPTRAME